MKFRTKVVAAVVFSFAVGAGAGFVQVVKHDVKVDYAAQCKTELKASFTAVFQGKLDPLEGKMPEPCTHLDEETYDQIATEVIIEVSREVTPSMPVGA